MLSLYGLVVLLAISTRTNLNRMFYRPNHGTKDVWVCMVGLWFEHAQVSAASSGSAIMALDPGQQSSAPHLQTAFKT
jgi:hypothetical protein